MWFILTLQKLICVNIFVIKCKTFNIYFFMYGNLPISHFIYTILG